MSLMCSLESLHYMVDFWQEKSLCFLRPIKDDTMLCVFVLFLFESMYYPSGSQTLLEENDVDLSYCFVIIA